jgi:hypothetical protein
MGVEGLETKVLVEILTEAAVDLELLVQVRIKLESEIKEIFIDLIKTFFSCQCWISII